MRLIEAHRKAESVLNHFKPFEYSECTSTSESLGMPSPNDGAPNPFLDPRDEAAVAAELERMDIVHTVFKLAMDGDLRAAEMLVLHTHGLDGASLEDYGVWIGELWLANPRVLEHVASRSKEGVTIIVGEVFASILNEYPSFQAACATINQHHATAPLLARALRTRLNTEAPHSLTCSATGTQKSDGPRAAPAEPGVPP